jgi:hypothetical protein
VINGALQYSDISGVYRAHSPTPGYEGTRIMPQWYTGKMQKGCSVSWRAYAFFGEPTRHSPNYGQRWIRTCGSVMPQGLRTHSFSLSANSP